jgi:hypothetical protein
MRWESQRWYCHPQLSGLITVASPVGSGSVLLVVMAETAMVVSVAALVDVLAAAGGLHPVFNEFFSFSFFSFFSFLLKLS